MRYVQSMYYRDWTLDYRLGRSIPAGGSTSINVPLYTASAAPINGLSDIDHLDLYLYVITDVPLRIAYGSVSQDVLKSGVVKLVIPGSSLPSGIVSYFGNTSGPAYYMLPVSVTNLSTSAGTFRVPHYEALVDYRSGATPNPYKHGTDPDPGGYVMPGDALWSTRFLHRGGRSAFPFMVFSQCAGQALARTLVSVLLPPVRNLGQEGGGMEFLYLVWSVNRLNHFLGLVDFTGGA